MLLRKDRRCDVLWVLETSNWINIQNLQFLLVVQYHCLQSSRVPSVHPRTRNLFACPPRPPAVVFSSPPSASHGRWGKCYTAATDSLLGPFAGLGTPCSQQREYGKRYGKLENPTPEIRALLLREKACQWAQLFDLFQIVRQYGCTRYVVSLFGHCCLYTRELKHSSPKVLPFYWNSGYRTWMTTATSCLETTMTSGRAIRFDGQSALYSLHLAFACSSSV